MATTLSPAVANEKANPLVPNNAKMSGAMTTIAMTSEAPILALNDVHILHPVSVDAVISRCELASDKLGTTGALGLGFHKKNADDSFSDVAVTALGSALDVSTTAVPFTDRRFATADINSVMFPVWKLAGLSARPDYANLYIGVKASTATTAGGTLSLRVSLQQN